MTDARQNSGFRLLIELGKLNRYFVSLYLTDYCSSSLNLFHLMNMNRSKYCCLSLVSLVLTLNSAIAVHGTEYSSVSPQLNSLSVFSTLDRDFREDISPVYLSKNSSSREYTFKAPDSKTLSNSGNLTAVQGYKVEVYGNEQTLLREVRNIEPKAFIKGDLIQVGIFSQQNNAEAMVRKLAVKGLWARIIVQ